MIKLFILLTSSSFTFGYSNMECIYRALGRVKKGLVLKNMEFEENSKQTKRLSSNNKIFNDLSFKSTFKYSENREEKTGFQLIEKLYRNALTAENSPHYFVAERICTPYLVSVDVHQVPARVHCHMLMQGNKDFIEHTVKYARIAHKIFGLLFQNTMAEVILDYQNLIEQEESAYLSHGEDFKDKLDAFKKKQVSIIKANQEIIEEKFESLFFNQFEYIELKYKKKHFKSLVVKDQDEFPKIILKTIKEIHQDLDSRIIDQANMLTLSTLSFKENFENEVLEKVIMDAGSTIREQNDNLIYLRIPDLILRNLNFSHVPHQLFIMSKFGPYCFEAFTRVKIMMPVQQCQSLLEQVFSHITDLEDEFLLNSLLKNRTFTRKLSTLLKTFFLSLKEDQELYYEIIPQLKERIKKQLDTEKEYFKKVFDFFADKDYSPKKDSIYQFMYDFKDLQHNLDLVISFLLHENKLDQSFYDTRNELYASNKVTKHLEGIKASFLHDNYMIEKEVVYNKFVDNFEEYCGYYFKDGELCMRIFKTLEFYEFSKYSASSKINELIVYKLSQDLQSYDLLEKSKDDKIETSRNLLVKQKEELGKFLNDESFQLELRLNDPQINTITLNEMLITAKFVCLIEKIPFNKDIRDLLYYVALEQKGYVREDIGVTEKEKLFNTVGERIVAYYEEGNDPKDIDVLQRYEKLTQEEKEFFNESYEYFLIRYDSWNNELKSLMNQCELPFPRILDSIEECEKKYGRECIKVNPFVLRTKCKIGETLNSEGDCVENCPKGFSNFTNKTCDKPSVYIIEKSENCGDHFVQVKNLCFPRCPLGWKDSGVTCERPFFRSGYMFLVE